MQKVQIFKKPTKEIIPKELFNLNDCLCLYSTAYSFMVIYMCSEYEGNINKLLVTKIDYWKSKSKELLQLGHELGFL